MGVKTVNHDNAPWCSKECAHPSEVLMSGSCEIDEALAKSGLLLEHILPASLCG